MRMIDRNDGQEISNRISVCRIDSDVAFNRPLKTRQKVLKGRGALPALSIR